MCSKFHVALGQASSEMLHYAIMLKKDQTNVHTVVISKLVHFVGGHRKKKGIFFSKLKKAVRDFGVRASRWGRKKTKNQRTNCFAISSPKFTAVCCLAYYPELGKLPALIKI
jgi:hypothetical protein